MSWIVIIAVILAAVVIVLVKLPKKNLSKLPGYPYKKIGVLFTPAERSFLGVLEQVTNNSAKIFGKVRVADVVAPEKSLSRSNWQIAFNKISRKHFDFLLCRNDDLSVICAIELDDSSHQSKKRQQRDNFLNGVCDAAGIPLIQIPAKSGYIIDEVKHLLAHHLSVNELPNQETAPLPQTSVDDEKVCPKCSSTMIKRLAKRGSNTGKQFWACSAYPKCRHIMAINEQ